MRNRAKVGKAHTRIRLSPSIGMISSRESRFLVICLLPFGTESVRMLELSNLEFMRALQCCVCVTIIHGRKASRARFSVSAERKEIRAETTRLIRRKPFAEEFSHFRFYVCKVHSDLKPVEYIVSSKDILRKGGGGGGPKRQLN